jgi:hypothetical protein
MNIARITLIAASFLVAGLDGCASLGTNTSPTQAASPATPPDAATLEAEAMNDVHSILTTRNSSEQLAVDANSKFAGDTAKLSHVQLLYGQVAASGNAWLTLYKADLAIASKNKALSDSLKKGAADVDTKYKALQAAVYPNSSGGALLDVIGTIITAAEDIYKAVRDAQQADRDRIVKAVSTVLDTEVWRPWATVTMAPKPAAEAPAQSTPTPKPSISH